VELTGADIFVRSLHKEGVEYIFGYPGGAVLHSWYGMSRQLPMLQMAMPVPPVNRVL